MPWLYVSWYMQAHYRTSKMKRFGFYTNVVIVVWFVVVISLFGHKSVDNRKKTMYNCDLAEISPDFPLSVKQECRNKRLKDEQRNNQGDSVTGGR